MADETDAVRFEMDPNGVAILTLDDRNNPVNTMNRAYTASMERAVDRVIADRETIKGVIVTSAKKTFFAGGDLKSMMLAQPEDAERYFDDAEQIKATLRRLETCELPVVAALNGSALGGGLEIALAAHYRIAVDDGRSEFGLPEVGLGLLPGGGGVTRTVRMFGVQKALAEVLLPGTRFTPAAAKAVGLVDELVEDIAQLLPAAKAWIESQVADGVPGQPWDSEDYSIPGGTPSTPPLSSILPSLPAKLRKQLKGADVKAPKSILAASVEGAQVDFDTASRIESRYFAQLVTGQQFKNTTQALFFDMGAIRRGDSRPAGVETRRFEKVAVLGAGMMGAGIAYVSAKAGLRVVLKDRDLETAERGKTYAEKLLTKRVTRGEISESEADSILARIVPTGDYADLEGCDLVIEAVFESVAVKQEVFRELQHIVRSDAILGSNTSTLPISELAEAVDRREDFIGIHFFSPVDKMLLVEVVVGKETSDATLAGTLDFVKLIRKTPIVVNDSRGFFTSRVISAFLNEGLAMLSEGVHPVTLERAAMQAGFPVGTLQLSDELTLTLSQRITRAHREAVESEGGIYTAHPAEAVVDRLIELGRPGRFEGAGFYEYDSPGGRRGAFWAELSQHFPQAQEQPPFDDVKERLLFIMSLETARCFDENVLRTAAEANVGSILGIGFPVHHGGAMQFMNGYTAADGEAGLEAFVRRADQLATRYGDRFDPPASLRSAATTMQLV